MRSKGSEPGGLPWSVLPAELGPLLRPHLQAVADEVIVAVGSRVAEYQRPLEGSFGAGVLVGVQTALARFLDLPGTTEPALVGDREIYVGLGRGEVRQGRSLASLLAAYRAGARVAFRAFADIARTSGLDADHLVPLAEAMFAYIDELSAASVEGFAAEQAARAGEQERRRGELVALVLAGGADPAAVAELARQLAWPLPDDIVVVLVPPAAAVGLATHLGRDVLVGEHAEGAVAVLPAPPRASSRQAIGHLLAGRHAVVGPVRPWREAAASLRLAALATRLVGSGVLTGDPVWVDEQTATLVLHRDPELVAELVRRALAPLDAAKPAARERLAETLLCWLAHRGERQRVADTLHVHAQTVGYRLGQLRELFGDALEDPDARFEIELALRAVVRS